MKELKKMNLNELKSLSRKEMKNIMAGSGDCTGTCRNDTDCSGLCKCDWPVNTSKGNCIHI